MIRPQLFTNHKISKGVTPVRRTGNFLKLASVAAVGALSFGVTPFASAQEADVATGSPVESASMRELAEDSTVLDVAPVDEAQPETASATAQPTAEPQQSDLTKASPAATTAPVTPKAAPSSSSAALRPVLLRPVQLRPALLRPRRPHHRRTSPQSKRTL